MHGRTNASSSAPSTDRETIGCFLNRETAIQIPKPTAPSAGAKANRKLDQLSVMHGGTWNGVPDWNQSYSLTKVQALISGNCAKFSTRVRAWTTHADALAAMLPSPGPNPDALKIRLPKPNLPTDQSGPVWRRQCPRPHPAGCGEFRVRLPAVCGEREGPELRETEAWRHQARERPRLESAHRCPQKPRRD